MPTSHARRIIEVCRGVHDDVGEALSPLSIAIVIDGVKVCASARLISMPMRMPLISRSRAKLCDEPLHLLVRVDHPLAQLKAVKVSELFNLHWIIRCADVEGREDDLYIRHHSGYGT